MNEATSGWAARGPPDRRASRAVATSGLARGLGTARAVTTSGLGPRGQMGALLAARLSRSSRSISTVSAAEMGASASSLSPTAKAGTPAGW